MLCSRLRLEEAEDNEAEGRDRVAFLGCAVVRLCGEGPRPFEKGPGMAPREQIGVGIAKWREAMMVM